MRMLVCAFAGRTYQIVGNLMLWLKCNSLGEIGNVLNVKTSKKILQLYQIIFQENNTWLRNLQLLSNFANQLYFPLEHIAWFADKKLIHRQSTNWWTAGTVAWAVSLFSEILK